MADTQSNKDKTPAELEAEIARTRARIEGEVDELGNKVSPSNIASNAKDALGEAQHAVADTVHDLTATVTDSAAEWSGTLVDVIKRNPLPAALVGLGIGLLAAGGAGAARSNNSNNEDQDYENTRSWGGPSEPVRSSQYGTANYGAAGSQRSLPASSSYSSSFDGNRSGDSYTAQAQRTAREAQRGFMGWVHDNPLLAGAAVVIAGIGVGLAVPTSRYEDEFMGEASDHLLAEARGKLSDTVEVVKETAQETVKTVKEEAANKLDGVSVKKTIRGKAKEAGNAVKDIAESAAQTAKTTADKKAQERNLKPS